MASLRRRLENLEDTRRRERGTADEDTTPASDEFFEQQLEWTALDLVRGTEPDFTLDETGSFVTLDGRFAVSPRRMDLRGLMGPRTEEIQEAIANTPEQWERFLIADDEAAELLQQLLRLAEDAAVPDDYREPGHKWHDHGEVCDLLGQHELVSVFHDSDEREATRRMPWTLIHNPAARAMLSGLTRRREAFLAEEARENSL
jgi:hypothetical protein